MMSVRRPLSAPPAGKWPTKRQAIDRYLILRAGDYSFIIRVVSRVGQSREKGQQR